LLKHELKIEILQHCIIPVLLYGCQTWALTAVQKGTIDICQHKMERRILNIRPTDRISYEEVRRRSGYQEPGAIQMAESYGEKSG
jgi:hypothetical protein